MQPVASSGRWKNRNRLTQRLPDCCARKLFHWSELFERGTRVLGQRTFRQDLQVLFEVFPRLVFVSEFFLAFGDTEAGHGVIIFVVERFLVAFERGLVVLAFEVKISDLNIFRRLQRIPGMELLNASGVGITGNKVLNGVLAGGMVLGIVLGRTQVDSRIAAGA